MIINIKTHLPHLEVGCIQLDSYALNFPLFCFMSLKYTKITKVHTFIFIHSVIHLLLSWRELHRSHPWSSATVNVVNLVLEN